MATYTFFNSWKESQLRDADANTPIDFDGDDIRAALITSAVAPIAGTHDFWDDLSANEVTGTGYTAGGTALGSKTVTETTGTVTFDSADVVFSQNGAGFTNARYAILYKFNATAANAPMIGWLDFIVNKGTVEGDLTLQWATTGIFTMA